MFHRELTQNKENKIERKHKTTEFQYLLERKAFRMMKKYYKDQFEEFASKYKFKRRVKTLDRETSKGYFKEFVQLKLKNVVDIFESLDIDNLVASLESIVLCDRYNK